MQELSQVRRMILDLFRDWMKWKHCWNWETSERLLPALGDNLQLSTDAIWWSEPAPMSFRQLSLGGYMASTAVDIHPIVPWIGPKRIWGSPALRSQSWRLLTVHDKLPTLQKIIWGHLNFSDLSPGLTEDEDHSILDILGLTMAPTTIEGEIIT